jgi:hypothetical protein
VGRWIIRHYLTPGIGADGAESVIALAEGRLQAWHRDVFRDLVTRELLEAGLARVVGGQILGGLRIELPGPATFDRDGFVMAGKE